ncbi:ferritin-like domain-containing protein [Kineosporia rhizophila]|uniref:DUF4439 domain-containing protein n=1 Tax=Kineosporia rhizophila TaxID=84633 RepID=UPI001E617E89|nr:ferritin-like domain-containing protein [Kineosporia rhizophila]
MLSRVTATSPAPVSRRVLLALGTVTTAGGVAALSGCSTAGGTAQAASTTPPASTSTEAEEQAVAAVVAQVQALHTGASNLAAGTLPNGATLRVPGATARLLTRITAVHEAQLTALGSSAPTSTPTPTPTVTAEAEAGINSPGAQATAEWKTARLALTSAAGLSTAFALLLYKIAASCAANADLLRSATKGRAFSTLTVLEEAGPQEEEPGLTDAEGEALNRLLAGEHAAFYAYPLVIAHIDKARQKVAGSVWAAHRQQRDELERLLMTAGQDPVESGAAYEVAAPAGAAKAAALAATIERRLAGLATDVIAAAETPQTGATAAGFLVVSTRRQAAWSNRPVAAPGA